ncbi:uncharacterized protein PRCAT00004954001 [Priceomyces carsonii]|uniref:uncharacterized protein n=1 Tax=Priceomyces carsonii TaxID=28549 RepID=UPI002ED7C08B|nr:unnamed protein product [Priceomyces carsonii]
MSVKEELNQLEKELLAKNPQDVLQFCANYFNQKLESQRKTLWAQQPMAKAAGIELFPKVEDIKTSRQPSFKSPFGENDPHLNHNEVLDNLFKGGFAVSNRTAPKLSREVDPNELSSQPQPLLQPQSKQIPVAFNANRRTSVSAEAMNPDKFKTDSWKPPKNDLTPKQRDELGNSLSSNFLFRQLEDDSRTTVLEALTKKTFKKDDQIIRQGDEGDYFYIIGSGTVDFYVNGAKVNSSGEGSSFGELALMYNSPRAATAIASSDQVTCWALDRLTFRRILLEGTFNRRLMYEDFLKDVEILSGLSNQERSKLADALSTEIYHKGDIIVKEGEEGENFYFIERGNCKVYKEGTGVLTHLQKGDYFGEVALLKDLPRQATVEALDTVVVATLDKSGFTRLLGPAVDVLKSKDPTK